MEETNTHPITFTYNIILMGLQFLYLFRFENAVNCLNCLKFFSKLEVKWYKRKCVDNGHNKFIIITEPKTILLKAEKTYLLNDHHKSKVVAILKDLKNLPWSNLIKLQI